MFLSHRIKAPIRTTLALIALMAAAGTVHAQEPFVATGPLVPCEWYEAGTYTTPDGELEWAGGYYIPDGFTIEDCRSVAHFSLIAEYFGIEAEGLPDTAGSEGPSDPFIFWLLIAMGLGMLLVWPRAVTTPKPDMSPPGCPAWCRIAIRHRHVGGAA